MTKTNSAVQFQPIVSDETKIEISLQAEEAVLRLFTWHEKLGWTTQKTMSFPTAMLDDLHRTVAAARYKMNNAESDRKENANSNVLKFPTKLK